MIFIKDINIGRFGNQLIYYNNLVQVANYFDLDYSAPRFNHDDIFAFEKKTNIPNSSIDIVSDSLLNKNHKFKNHVHLKPCLGDLFYVYDDLNTYEIFRFKDECEENNLTAVHFRGTDFHEWNPKSILPTSYYIDSIEYIKDGNFKLFTDDIELKSFKETCNYLDSNKIPYSLGNINNMESDFMTMSYADAIISSPSTFAITAGFCGKPNKKIIHSKGWVDYQCNLEDKFWMGFNQGGNKNYRKYKLI